MSPFVASATLALLLALCGWACLFKSFGFSTPLQKEGSWIGASICLGILAALVLFVGPSLLTGGNILLPLGIAALAIIFCLSLGAAKALLTR